MTLTLPLDADRPDATLDEAVILVRQLGAVLRRVDHRRDRPALVMSIPLRE
jgi:hypothetical protein